MKKNTNKFGARHLGALAITGALAFAACGSDDTADEPSTEMADDGAMDAMDDAAMDDAAMDDEAMDDMKMNMGDANATPADDVTDAVLARGEFALLETRPAGYDELAGTAVIARSIAGTTVTTELSGLLPNVDYISHVHAQACADENGGPHYQFEVGGTETPPNEIHLAFTSDADGNGFMTAENDMIAGIDAQALIVHPVEFIDNKVACVDFVEDEPGAIEALLNG